MKPWLVIPLDDRPCCWQFAQRLAPIWLPPLDWLGHFQRPGDSDALLDWLEEKLPLAQGAVVAIDMLTWGGLVASRHPQGQAEVALRRLERLQGLSQRHRILAFQTILRNAPTQLTPEDSHWAELLVQQSQHPQAELGIPPSILQPYLATRRRNQRIYQAVAAISTFDSLVFALDDSKTAGWNLQELRQLGAVRSLPGTDETLLLLLCRALRPGFSLQLCWSDPTLGELQGLYEDRPARAVVAAQLEAAGIQVEDSPHQVWFYGRSGQPQGEARFQTDQAPSQEWLQALGAALDQGQRVVLCDLTFANGGDLSLGRALRERGLWQRLAGYAAWNTLGNRVGTALATSVLGGDADFLAERVADDLLYQADYRWRAARLLGHNGLTLTAAEQERVAEEIFPALVRELQEYGFPPVQLNLPWGRLFEVLAQVSPSGRPLSAQ